MKIRRRKVEQSLQRIGTLVILGGVALMLFLMGSGKWLNWEGFSSAVFMSAIKKENALTDWSEKAEPILSAKRIESMIRSNSLVLIQLNPLNNPGSTSIETDSVRGRKLIGERKDFMLTALFAAVAQGPPEATTDWYPSYAIRMKTETGVMDFLICFECAKFEIHQAGTIRRGTISFYARDIFEAILEENGQG